MTTFGVANLAAYSAATEAYAKADAEVAAATERYRRATEAVGARYTREVAAAHATADLVAAEAYSAFTLARTADLVANVRKAPTGQGRGVSATG